MLRNEIIRSCSHEAVATAALLSLGAEFHARIALLAGAHEKSAGQYSADMVRQFAADADEDAWCALGSAIARRDMPILAGLRFILETMIDGAAAHDAQIARTGRRASVRGKLKTSVGYLAREA